MAKRSAAMSQIRRKKACPRQRLGHGTRTDVTSLETALAWSTLLEPIQAGGRQGRAVVVLRTGSGACVTR